jgi:hypothetical protein
MPYDSIKLQGDFLLVRTGRMQRGRPQWLWMKREDQAAQSNVDPAVTEPWSVLSGLWIEDLATTDGHP